MRDSIRQSAPTIIIGILAGLSGMGLWQLAAHAREDHAILHALDNIVVQQLQAAQKAAKASGGK